MIRLYYGSGSPFSWRVQLAIEEKGLPYEPVLLSFDKGEVKSPEHLARNPHGKVPALTDGALTLYESGAIVEYLEDRYPEPPLMPADAAGKALVRIEEIECTLYFGEAFRTVAVQLFLTPPDRRDATAINEGKAAVRAELERLEKRTAQRGGKFIAGSALSRADLAWLPFVELCGRTGEQLDSKRTPWLVGWLERMRARPSYDKSYPPHWRG